MVYKEKFAQLLLAARTNKEKQHRGQYTQRVLASKLGVSLAVYNKWESGNFDRLPDPNVLSALGKELGLTTVEMLDAAGYDVELSQIEEVKINRTVEMMSLADFLHRKYRDIQSYENLADTLEELIESRRIREQREASAEKGYPLAGP